LNLAEGVNGRCDFTRHERHGQGTLAEIAVAKRLGLPWRDPVWQFRRLPDVGDYEVRSSRVGRVSPDGAIYFGEFGYADVRVKLTDPPDRPIIQVAVYSVFHHHLIGWTTRAIVEAGEHKEEGDKLRVTHPWDLFTMETLPGMKRAVAIA
jgi:hypothetical protein